MTSILRRLFLGQGDDRNDSRLSYEQAKKMATSADPSVRRQLAARADVVPEILYYLADDPDVGVRREIAVNESAPAQANLVLATDSDVAVRTGLAEKVARIAPGLSAEEQDRLRRMTYETLQLLARDQALRVRQILAETLKDVAHVPAEVIRRLARDAELAVSAPVLEYSPVLSDDDLLEIINSGPITGALSAISRRSGIHPAVTDAIAASSDSEAIAVMLGNASAQIREETLDSLVERAPHYDHWHAPLVNRPNLPARAAARLALFVADNLVQQLQDRNDLDEQTAIAVAQAVRKRLEERGPPERSTRAAEPPVGKPLEMATHLHQQGLLDDKLVGSALTSNDREFVVAALAVLSGLPLDIVQKVVVTQSPKGMLSLAWKAGLKVQLAVLLQTKLARIPPSDVIGPGKGGDYPLEEAEMVWQLKFFSSLTGTEA